MFPDLEFIKTCLNAITYKFRRVKSDVDAVKSDVDAVKSDVDAVKSDVDAVKSSSPDWNEPNIASHAYIKNKPFGKRLVVTGTSAMSHQGAAFIASNVPENALIVGRYYAVYVDGKLSFSAECVADTINDYPSLHYLGSSIHLRPDGYLIAWTSTDGQPWSTEGLPVEIYEVMQIPPEYLTAPDWNEPDTASHSYIKNKPCYDYIEPSGVIWESDSAGTNGQSALVLVDLGDGWLIEGETYRLTVDGVETTYVCAADADGRGLYIGAGYADFNNGSIFQSNTNARLSACTGGLWDYGQKVRLEGPLRKYKKLDTSFYDAVVSVNGETGDVQITPENIMAAKVGSMVVSGTIATAAIYGTYNEETCDALYLGGQRYFAKGIITDTKEECFFLGPGDTILAGIKTPISDNHAANKGYVDATVAAPRDSIRLYSSTEGSTKQFELTVNDDGVISAVEVAE